MNQMTQPDIVHAVIIVDSDTIASAICPLQALAMPHSDTPPTSNSTGGKAPNVAIVGGGLIGVMLGLGLSHRNIPFTIYERASDWHEIGAGVALTSVAQSSMQRLHPEVLPALHRVAKANHFGFWDGFTPSTKEAAQASEALHFLLDVPGTDYWCCMRSQFLRELVALLPKGSTRFNKELESYVDDPSREQVLLRFTDGTTAEADTCETSPLYPSCQITD